MRAQAVGQVADVTLLAWHGNDLAAKIEHGARAGRRQRRVTDPARTLHEPRPQLAQVGGHANRQLLAGPRLRVEHVQHARLFVDDAVGTVRCAQDGKVGMLRDLTNLFALRVVGEHVEFAVAIGSEIDRVANPHRIGVVRSCFRLRDLVDRMRLSVVQPQARHGSAAILLPLLISSGDGVVGDALPVGGIGGARRVRNRQRLFDAPADGNREQLAVTAGERGALRGEEDRLAVRREALHDVGAGMPRQAHRRTAADRHDEHVGVAVVLRAERDRPAVRRKHRV